MVALHALQAASQLGKHWREVVIGRIEKGGSYWLRSLQTDIVRAVAVGRRIAFVFE